MWVKCHPQRYPQGSSRNLDLPARDRLHEHCSHDNGGGFTIVVSFSFPFSLFNPYIILHCPDIKFSA